MAARGDAFDAQTGKAATGAAEGTQGEFGQKNSPADAEPAKNRSLNEIIAENHDVIAKTGIIVEMSGNEFQGGDKKLVDQVTEFFESIGNRVTRVGIGDVTLNRGGARDSISHGMGRNKAIAFAAVPSVIENGEIVDTQKNWKGRRYDTITFGGRVKINGIEYDMGVIVKQYNNAKKSGKFYLHEVLLADAENGAVSFKTGTVVGYPSDTAPLSPDGKAEANPSDVSVPQAEQDSNLQNDENKPAELAKTPIPRMRMTFGHAAAGAVESVAAADTGKEAVLKRKEKNRARRCCAGLCRAAWRH